MDINNLMKQAQEMQEKMAELQSQAAKAEFTGESGAGMVKVIMTGTVTDLNTNDTLREATLNIKNKSGEIVATLVTDAKGGYNVNLEPDQTYTVEVQKENHKNEQFNLNTDFNTPKVKQNVALENRPNVTYIGIVTDTKTNNKLQGVKVTVKDLSSGKEILITNSDVNGSFTKAFEDLKYGKEQRFEIKLEKKDYATKLIEDQKIRKYLNARINKGGIARIVIERTLGKLIITIHTSKPGIIIGKGGGEVDRIKEELKKLTGKDDVQINILEIRRPELDATIVADTIARQIENRINYKRAIKMAIASTLRMGAEGIKVKVGGRIGGAEIARSEEIKQGRVPLHTFRMDIDYASIFALTVYGKIGIKVWICKGEVLGKRELNPNFVGGKDGGERADHPRGGGDRRDDRRDGGDRRGPGGQGGPRRK